MTQQPIEDIPLTIGAVQKQKNKINKKNKKRVKKELNRCEDLIKLIVNLINLSFVSNLRSSDPHQ